MKKYHITAKIKYIGINPGIDVPENVITSLQCDAGKKKGPLSVRGTINNTEFIQTVVKFRDAWRLYINTQLRHDSGLKVGDVVNINIEFDPNPRVVPMSIKLAEAFSINEKARIAFYKLPPSHQKEILKYLNSLKTEEALSRAVKMVIEKELDP